jgi:NAD(P)-dependent dehydrogenase (short-subunit alcohol dehydrogenase family)
VTALAFAVARLRPEVRANAVDPGWVPTRMGGRGAPEDLGEGCATQVALATSSEPAIAGLRGSTSTTWRCSRLAGIPETHSCRISCLTSAKDSQEQRFEV